MTLKLVFDLETLPDLRPDAKERIRPEVKPPANYSKPDTIAAWWAEKGEQELDRRWRATALSGASATICCIGYAFDDAPVGTLLLGRDAEDEADLLRQFFALVRTKTAAAMATTAQVEFVGHNILAFDLRLLYQRAVVLGVDPRMFLPIDARHGGGRVFDTMLAWAGPRDTISLSNLCAALGITDPKADGIDGSKVADLWLAGEHQRIADYCAADVWATREAYLRLSFAAEVA